MAIVGNLHPDVAQVARAEIDRAQNLIQAPHWSGLDLVAMPSAGTSQLEHSSAAYLLQPDTFVLPPTIILEEEVYGTAQWSPNDFADHIRKTVVGAPGGSATDVLRWVLRHEIGHFLDDVVLRPTGLRELFDQEVVAASKPVLLSKMVSASPEFALIDAIAGARGISEDTDQPAYFELLRLGLGVSAAAAYRWSRARSDGDLETGQIEARAEAVHLYLDDPRSPAGPAVVGRAIFEQLAREPEFASMLRSDWQQWSNAVFSFQASRRGDQLPNSAQMER